MNTVIGIDHGYGYMKTANAAPFLSGITEFKVEPPFSNRTLCFDGRYYVCGEQRAGYNPLKTENLNYYILTLASMAEELKIKKASYADVTLAVGLPLEYFGNQKDSFRKYLTQNKEVKFKYEGISYEVKIQDVYIFPQGYSIVAQNIKEYMGTKLVIDVGSWTVDIIPFLNMMPQQGRCESIPYGVISCIERIQQEFRRVFNSEVDDNQIQDIFLGRNSLPEKYLEAAEDIIRAYVKEIMNQLQQKKYNLDVMEVYYCGGGASVIKKYGEYDCRLTHFIEDINANAKGYEYLCKGILNKRHNKK